MNDLLFVYGSLRSTIAPAVLPFEARTAAHALETAATRIGPASVSGRLYAVSWYPALAPDSAARVVGEVWRLREPATLLHQLDQYEGEDYHREEMQVLTVGGDSLSAWVYVYDAPLEDAQLIDSGDYAHWIAQQTP